MAEHGDAKLTKLLVTLADCPKALSASTTGVMWSTHSAQARDRAVQIHRRILLA
jgi:hypothetical protein